MSLTSMWLRIDRRGLFTFLLSRVGSAYILPVKRVIVETAGDCTHLSCNYSCSAKSDEFPKLCGPSVRNLLEEYGIKYSVVTATGPHNVLLKGDVLEYINCKNLKPKQQAEVQPSPDITFVEGQYYTDFPVTSLKKTYADHLIRSKTTIPHAYMSIECLMNEVMNLQNMMESENDIISLNDLIIKCAAGALVSVPELNVIKLNDKAIKSQSIDISVAVDSEKGQITPVLKQADCLSVHEISKQLEASVEKMKANDSHPIPVGSDGGAFSISNLGTYEVCQFNSVISSPQVAVLSVGTPQLTVSENKTIKVVVSLSYDASVVDAVDAARFLQSFKEHLENPFGSVVNLPAIMKVDDY